MNTKLAVQYEQIIQRKGYRPNSMRIQLLQILCGLNAPTDAVALNNSMTDLGFESDTESVRLQLKRLGEAGVLLKFPQPGKNKYLVQLRPIHELEDDEENNFSMNNQPVI